MRLHIIKYLYNCIPKSKHLDFEIYFLTCFHLKHFKI